MALTGYERKSLEQYTAPELREIAKTYGVTFKTEAGNTSLNYSRLNKTQLIYEITYDVDYIRANPNLKYDDVLKNKQNRIVPIKRDLIGIETPGELMYRIIKALDDTKGNIPVAGNYYTFIYRAITPGLLFDLHPLIRGSDILTDKFFIGYNYHWQLRGGQSPIRKYLLREVQSDIYQMSTEEFITLRGVNYQKFIQNRS